MTTPWEDRVAMADPDPHAAVMRALLRAGQKVVGRKEGGRPGHTLSVTYTFDCGCRRTYKADQRTAEEAEYLSACAAHKDLVAMLRDGAEQATLASENPLTRWSEASTIEVQEQEATPE